MDVLIFLNTLVDYFLVLATAKITREKPTAKRLVISAVLGGISSVYIFLPNQKTIVEFLYKLGVAFCISAVCFGIKGKKRYLKNTAVFFLITCAYAGVMFAFWTVFKPFGMVINNSVVYFHISPLVLVLCTVFGYFIFAVLWRVFGKSANIAERCEITVFAEGKSVTLTAISDTGNSIEDFFQKSDVIIADKQKVEALFGVSNIETNPELKRRYRVLPCSTVSGFDTLDSFRCDSATVEHGNKKTKLLKPLLAVSKVSLNDDYNAIVNPNVLR